MTSSALKTTTAVPKNDRLPKIHFAGHRGMVGSGIVRQLLAQGPPVNRVVMRTRAELDLTGQAAVWVLFAAKPPDQICLAATSVHVMSLGNANYGQCSQPMVSHINLGCGYDITIWALAKTIALAPALRAASSSTPPNLMALRESSWTAPDSTP